MNVNCVIFAAKYLVKEEIENKRVIEIGACDINGSLKSFIEHYHPKEYLGADIIPGPGVNIICDVNNLISHFGEKSFDMVLATELLEHVRDWKSAIHNIKNVCKTNAIVLISTRSYGFPYHDYPFDYWRYELEDMKSIFSDFIIEKIEKDPGIGVFLKATKPDNFAEKDLAHYELYSIVTNRKTKELWDKDLKNLFFRTQILKTKLKKYLLKLINA